MFPLTPDPGQDLPVVPAIRFEGEKTPKNMSWKHLLLGAGHNTSTGHHRSPKDMQILLPKLVSWFPPEDLGKDC